jgi:hypothetical protein
MKTPIANSRHMHLARLNNRLPSHILRRLLPPVQRSVVAVTALVCPVLLARFVHRDYMSTVGSFRPTKVVQGVTRRLMMFEVPRTVLCASSSTRRDGPGCVEEGDEERFDGWETRGDDADVHFDDLPDVCCVLLARLDSGLRSERRVPYSTMSLCR